MSRERSATVTARAAWWRAGSIAGAIVGYGYLAAFLALVGFQAYRWFQEGEWTHIGVNDGMRAALARLGGAENLTGRLGALAHWLDAPVTWLGLHRVLDVLPASLALFAISILGNFMFIYAGDHLRDMQGAGWDDQRVERDPEQATNTPSAM
jgi:hypothetical protein